MVRANAAKRCLLSISLFLSGIILLPSVAAWAQWKPHRVIQFNGRTEQRELDAKTQIMTESWNTVVSVPYVIYLPEKDRLLMIVDCGGALILRSDDRGATWSKRGYVHTDASGNPDTGMGCGLTYLGNGKLSLFSGTSDGFWGWFSSDYGETWSDRAAVPSPFDSRFTYCFGWDPPLVDRDVSSGEVKRLLLGGYLMDQLAYKGAAMPGFSLGGLRTSTDMGRTWSDVVNPSQWRGCSEIAFVRAKNGDLVAACRVDWPTRFHKNNLDNYDGLGVSISKDNGETWSAPAMLYDWGRHHPSMVLTPNGDIVMTYVVRKGYPETTDGYLQFGVEAVVSHDNGQTWDLDHRYILNRWKAIKRGPHAWSCFSQMTSTVLLPDGSLLTAYTTGRRNVPGPGMLDIGLVSWTPSDAPVNADRTIAEAPFDSRLRNEYNPDLSRKKLSVYCPAQPNKRNVAMSDAGARVIASASDDAPTLILRNPYNQPVLTLETLPAWVELHWSKKQRIDEIHLQPGAPEWYNRPSTECVPLDYRLQCLKEGKWVDLIPPVENAKRYIEFYGGPGEYIFRPNEFEYLHIFAPVSTKAVRLYITRTSDSGKRPGGGQEIVVPEMRRETCLRAIEVFAAQ